MTSRYTNVWLIAAAILVLASCQKERPVETPGEAQAPPEHRHGEEEAGHEHEAGDKRGGHAQEEHEQVHGDQHHEHAQVPISELSNARCEHAMAMVECDECRYELGVVRVPPDIEKDLIRSTTATALHRDFEPVVLRCETDVNELLSTDVVALNAGRVEQVLKGLGDKVQQGDVLAVLHSNEFARVRLSHKQVHQNLDLAQARFSRLEKVQADLRKLLDCVSALEAGPPDYDLLAQLEVGTAKARLMEAANGYIRALADRKREEQVILDGRRLSRKLRKGESVDPEKYRIGQWKGPLLEATADVRLSERTVKRAEKLRSQGLVSVSEQDRATRDQQAAAGRLAAALEQVELDADRVETHGIEAVRNARAALQGAVEEQVLALEIERLEASQALENRKTEVAVSHQTLLTYGLTEDELEQPAGQDNAGLARLELRAPAAGVVLAQHISVGRLVPAGTSLFRLSDLGQLWVWCDVYEKDISRIELSPFPLPVKVLTDAYPGLEFRGSLDYLSAFSDAHSRTLKARVVTDSKGGLLKPKMFATAHVALADATSGVLVPDSAVVSDEGQSFVFIRWRDNFWVRRGVEPGPQTTGGRLIRSGIEVGDEVATTGAFFLKSDILREKMGAGCAH